MRLTPIKAFPQNQAMHSTFTKGLLQLRASILFTSFGLLASLAHAGEPSGAISSPEDRISSIQIHPAAIELVAGGAAHRILLTAVTERQLTLDRTAAAQLEVVNAAIATLDDKGVIHPQSEGETTLVARLGDLSSTMTIRVRPAKKRALSFENDILPVLSRAGCNAGECHAKASGQAGFKLSVFAYDTRADYREIVQDARGRRVFPAAPDQSLILLKPTNAVEHGGGKRFDKDSDFYRTLHDWIASGLPRGDAEEPKLEGITVFPPEGRYAKAAEQPLVVQARYSDGSVRDVTDLAKYSTNNEEIVGVNQNGRMTAGKISGESVVVARYMGLVNIARVALPSDRSVPDEFYHTLPINNEIDRLVYLRLKKLGILPSPSCDDATILRRTSLDIVGALPTVAETEAFLADASPDKRERLIDRLLGDPRYADYWATKWGDLIRPNPARVGVKSVYVFDEWIRRSLRENKPYDQFVREIITASGTTHRDGPTVLFRDRSDPEQVTPLVSQIFLGVRMECAKCHHHPNEKWSQQDFYQLAAFFGKVGHKGTGISPPISGSTEYIFHTTSGEVRHPVTREVMKPTPPEGKPAEIEDDSDPRGVLADWMTDPANPFFARAIVNRVWADMMGRGIVMPVDDFRASNPPTNAPLLDWLAADLVAHKYDLKHLIGTIARSHVYQLDSRPIPENVADNENFSRAYRRRLRAEVLLDAVSDITETSESFDGLPAGSRAIETWSNNINSQFMDAFGRPDSSQDCTCERDSSASLVQALHLMNSDKLQTKIASDSGRAARLSNDEAKSMKDIIREVYLAAYARPPSETELASTSEILFNAPGVTRRSAIEDVMWTLINSAEFVFNH